MDCQQISSDFYLNSTWRHQIWIDPPINLTDHQIDHTDHYTSYACRYDRFLRLKLLCESLENHTCIVFGLLGFFGGILTVFTFTQRAFRTTTDFFLFRLIGYLETVQMLTVALISAISVSGRCDRSYSCMLFWAHASNTISNLCSDGVDLIVLFLCIERTIACLLPMYFHIVHSRRCYRIVAVWSLLLPCVFIGLQAFELKVIYDSLEMRYLGVPSALSKKAFYGQVMKLNMLRFYLTAILIFTATIFSVVGFCSAARRKLRLDEYASSTTTVVGDGNTNTNTKTNNSVKLVRGCTEEDDLVDDDEEQEQIEEAELETDIDGQLQNQNNRRRRFFLYKYLIKKSPSTNSAGDDGGGGHSQHELKSVNFDSNQTISFNYQSRSPSEHENQVINQVVISDKPNNNQQLSATARRQQYTMSQTRKRQRDLCCLQLCLAVPIVINHMLYGMGQNTDMNFVIGKTAFERNLTYPAAIQEIHRTESFLYLRLSTNIINVLAHGMHFYLYLMFSVKVREGLFALLHTCKTMLTNLRHRSNQNKSNGLLIG